jgi:hypothetical protein
MTASNPSTSSGVYIADITGALFIALRLSAEVASVVPTDV